MHCSCLGLFHKAIMESGSAVSPWGQTYNPAEQAFEIGKRCGYYGNDPKGLLEYLKMLSPSSLTLASMDMIMDQRKVGLSFFKWDVAPYFEANSSRRTCLLHCL